MTFRLHKSKAALGRGAVECNHSLRFKLVSQRIYPTSHSSKSTYISPNGMSDTGGARQSFIHVILDYQESKKAAPKNTETNHKKLNVGMANREKMTQTRTG